MIECTNSSKEPNMSQKGQPALSASEHDPVSPSPLLVSV